MAGAKTFHFQDDCMHQFPELLIKLMAQHSILVPQVQCIVFLIKTSAI